MGRRIVSLTLDNVDSLPQPCRSCVFWESGARTPEPSLKDDWVTAVLLEWGSCGRVVYVDGQVAGFALYAPPRYVQRTTPLAAGSVSDDAALLSTVRILPEYTGGGLGRVLVQAVVKDLMGRRVVRALEAFGDAQGHENRCLVPARFLTAVGFKTVQPHPRYPRLRLDLRSVVTWRGEMETAVERWLGAIRPDKQAGRPVGVRPREDAGSEPTPQGAPRLPPGPALPPA